MLTLATAKPQQKRDTFNSFLETVRIGDRIGKGRTSEDREVPAVFGQFSVAILVAGLLSVRVARRGA